MEISDVLIYEIMKQYACDVCYNTPDVYGEINHGDGCYVVSEEGGGETTIEYKELDQKIIEAFIFYQNTIKCLKQQLAEAREREEKLKKYIYEIIYGPELKGQEWIDRYNKGKDLLTPRGEGGNNG